MSSRCAVNAAKKVFNHYFPERKWRGRTTGSKFTTKSRTSVCEPEVYYICVSSGDIRHSVEVSDLDEPSTFYVTLNDSIEGIPHNIYSVTEGVIRGGRSISSLEIITFS